MSRRRQEAVARFRVLYEAFRAARTEAERAAQWIIENESPYKKGQTVQCPMNATASAGKMITITSVSLDCCHRTGIVYWCIGGEGGFFRARVEDELPEAIEAKQEDLFK